MRILFETVKTEIRRVPANWRHPQVFNKEKNCLEYTPLFGETKLGYIAGLLKQKEDWQDGTHAAIVRNPALKEDFPTFNDFYGEPLEGKYFMPWRHDLTWWQLYEVESIGTPISPAFESEEKLKNYLDSLKD